MDRDEGEANAVDGEADMHIAGKLVAKCLPATALTLVDVLQPHAPAGFDGPVRCLTLDLSSEAKSGCVMM